ncbi:SitI3 family protein [Actinoplanes sp. NPDC051861]|uniref:SitI3 family protein n=1 Tax=Actinoplanes sp. NPDC051861 TaxID=3155170 RepID=UPI00342330A2
MDGGFLDPESSSAYLSGWKVASMIDVVRRVLDSGPEDAALTQNGDVLLLTRFDGVLVKHRREEWWNHYPTANTALPG